MTLTLAKLKELADKATKGPWKSVNCYGKHYEIQPEPGRTFYHYEVHDAFEFIAASREAVPLLIEEVKRLREALELYAAIPGCAQLDLAYPARQALRESLERLP